MKWAFIPLHTHHNGEVSTALASLFTHDAEDIRLKAKERVHIVKMFPCLLLAFWQAAWQDPLFQSFRLDQEWYYDLSVLWYIPQVGLKAHELVSFRMRWRSPYGRSTEHTHTSNIHYLLRPQETTRLKNPPCKLAVWMLLVPTVSLYGATPIRLWYVLDTA